MTWRPQISTNMGNDYEVNWVKLEEEEMDYEDYVGIAHQIMAMELGYV